MIGAVTDPPAVFDAEAVRSLIGHPGDAAFAVVFVTRYRGLLSERVRRIAAGLAAAETGGAANDGTDGADDTMDAAIDAVLSLKVASTIVGAHELADIAARLERLLRCGDLARAAAAEAALAGAAERADHALGGFLGE